MQATHIIDFQQNENTSSPVLIENACRGIWTQVCCQYSTIPFLSRYDFRFRLEDQAKNNDFHRFVEGHLIVKQGILYKKKGFFPKKRMFLLTEGPHLYYVDPDKMVLKGEIPWSSKLRTEIRDFRVFFVHVPGRTYYLVSGASTNNWTLLVSVTSVDDFWYYWTKLDPPQNPPEIFKYWFRLRIYNSHTVGFT